MMFLRFRDVVYLNCFEKKGKCLHSFVLKEWNYSMALKQKSFISSNWS